MIQYFLLYTIIHIEEIQEPKSKSTWIENI